MFYCNQKVNQEEAVSNSKWILQRGLTITNGIAVEAQKLVSISLRERGIMLILENLKASVKEKLYLTD